MAQLPDPKEQAEGDDAFRALLHDWVHSVRSSTNRRLAGAVHLAILAASPQIESFSGWLLAIAGATLGLMIANIGSIRAATDPSLLTAGTCWLMASCAFGVVEKYLALCVGTFTAMSRELETEITKVLDEYDEEIKDLEEVVERVAGDASIDGAQVLEELVAPLWPPFRALARRQFVQGWKEPASGLRHAYSLFQWQSLLGTVQILCVGVAAVCYARAVI